MDSETTASVSKGVFLFKNGFKPTSKSALKKTKVSSDKSHFSQFLWYKTYKKLWGILEDKIEVLNNEMFSSILHNLIFFVGSCYNEPVYEVPSAVLLTGVNMPDHGAQFRTLSKEIKELGSYVALLNSEDCSTLKSLMDNLIDQFVNEEYEDLDEESKDKKYKKSEFSFMLLQDWFKTVERKNLVVIIPDFEAFIPEVLQKFILILAGKINELPFVLVFGVATSLASLHSALPYKITSKISLEVFQSQPSTVYLNNILEEIFFTKDCPFKLGGNVFNLFTDIFLFYDFSVSGFIKNFKYSMLQHFYYGNAMALCSSKEESATMLKSFSHEDCENLRQVLSFRKLVEESDCKTRVRLLLEDQFFKDVVQGKIEVLLDFIEEFQLFLKCLLILVGDLPKSPLGKQLRELYGLATSQNITKTKEFKECFQLLEFQSQEEFLSKLTNLIRTLQNFPKNKSTIEQLQQEINKLNEDCHEESFEKETPKIGTPLNRNELKEKLKGFSKNKAKTKYEQFRTKVLEFLRNLFEEKLLEPKKLHFHEVFFFDDLSIQNHIIGYHRSAIHHSLKDPQFYLQCNCCKITNDSMIKPTMPDLAIIYKLHLECGKVINLYDWLQAFLSIVEGENCTSVSPQLQARFTQAVSELEFLGFVKSSKGKTDHVSRLTWGG